MSKPRRSQERRIRLRDGKEQNGEKDTAGRDRRDFGDKERCNKAIVKRDEMGLAASLTGVIPI